jgi:hypothetical protein
MGARWCSRNAGPQPCIREAVVKFKEKRWQNDGQQNNFFGHSAEELTGFTTAIDRDLGPWIKTKSYEALTQLSSLPEAPSCSPPRLNSGFMKMNSQA